MFNDESLSPLTYNLIMGRKKLRCIDVLIRVFSGLGPLLLQNSPSLVFGKHDLQTETEFGGSDVLYV